MHMCMSHVHVLESRRHSMEAKYEKVSSTTRPGECPRLTAHARRGSASSQASPHRPRREAPGGQGDAVGMRWICSGTRSGRCCACAVHMHTTCCYMHMLHACCYMHMLHARARAHAHAHAVCHSWSSSASSSREAVARRRCCWRPALVQPSGHVVGAHE